MAKRERRFDVVYTYYRYNSGDGQCGERRGRLAFRSRKEAVGLALAIRSAATGGLEGEQLRELETQTLPCDGYLIGAKVERLLIDRKEIAL